MDFDVGRCLIPDLLVERGWKPRDLVERTGLDKRTISFYSTNRRRKMPLVIAVIISDALGVNPRDLYENLRNRTISRRGTVQ